MIAALDEQVSSATTLEGRIRVLAGLNVGRVAFSTSLGVEDQVVLHAIAEAGADFDVFTLDTGRHFPETLDTIEASEQRYGISIRIVAPDANEVETLVRRDGIYGFRYSVEGRKSCCEARKVVPLRRALQGAGVWVTGLRRGQSAGRGSVRFVEFDAGLGMIKASPLADWSLERMEAFVREHDIPVNALHAKGFPSIGCQPCTRAISPGEDIRAGRWWWENEDGKECGLHNRPRITVGSA